MPRGGCQPKFWNPPSRFPPAGATAKRYQTCTPPDRRPLCSSPGPAAGWYGTATPQAGCAAPASDPRTAAWSPRDRSAGASPTSRPRLPPRSCSASRRVGQIIPPRRGLDTADVVRLAVRADSPGLVNVVAEIKGAAGVQRVPLTVGVG